MTETKLPAGRINPPDEPIWIGHGDWAIYLSVPEHDVFLEDNYVDLLPNRPLQVTCRTDVEIDDLDSSLKTMTITDACGYA